MPWRAASATLVSSERPRQSGVPSTISARGAGFTQRCPHGPKALRWWEMGAIRGGGPGAMRTGMQLQRSPEPGVRRDSYYRLALTRPCAPRAPTLPRSVLLAERQLRGFVADPSLVMTRVPPPSCAIPGWREGPRDARPSYRAWSSHRGSFWQLSPAASVIEQQVVSWLATLLSLPETPGALTSGGMATEIARSASLHDRVAVDQGGRPSTGRGPGTRHASTVIGRRSRTAQVSDRSPDQRCC
jgi:hypothetical protein